MFKKIKILYLIVFIFSVAIGTNVYAENESDAVKLTITPPLVKNNMTKGQSWISNLKVVNNGLEPVTVYTEVSDFISRADGAGPEFIAVDKADDKQVRHLLSKWIDIGQGPFVIPAQKSLEIPYYIKLPEDAEPGGHYAAILVGTHPSDAVSGSAIKTSSQIASLIMLEVAGDIKEEADITEFNTSKNLYQTIPVDFFVKFKNEGNIHLQPKGEIKIFSPWGDEKGKIAINQGTDFGNVLPNSTREWKFDWNNKLAFWEMGRFRADLVLTFGNEVKQSVDRSAYFWIVNVKLVSIVLGVIIFIVLMIYLLVRMSVRKAVLATTGLAPEKNIKNQFVRQQEKTISNTTSVSGPVDLRRDSSDGKRGRKILN